MNIGEVSKKMNIPISTLRYYEKEGLLPNIKRQDSGIRDYSENDLEYLRLIECLKTSGLKLKDIKIFMKWCKEGNSTLKNRLEMFEKQEKAINEQINKLNDTLNLIKFKKWYYQTAVSDGTDKKVKEMSFNEMPLYVQELYNKTH